MGVRMMKWFQENRLTFHFLKLLVLLAILIWLSSFFSSEVVAAIIAYVVGY